LYNILLEYIKSNGGIVNVLELYKDSLSYPTKDIDKFLTLGVLFFLDGIVSLLPSIAIALNQNLATQILYFISNIVGFIVIIIAIGYAFSIAKNTIFDSPMPSIEIIKNIIDGIKVSIISIIYYTIPFSVTLIIAYFSGVLNGVIDLSLIYLNYGPEVMSHIDHLSPLDFNMDILISVVVIGFILFLLATLFLPVAIARFAETNTVKSSLNFKGILEDISKITWNKYLIRLIFFPIILMIVFIISLVVLIIPFIGVILFFLTFSPFITIFSSRTLGLTYREKENDSV